MKKIYLNFGSILIIIIFLMIPPCISKTIAQTNNQIIYQDSFEGGLSGWNASHNPNNHIVWDNSGGYNSTWSLLLDYQGTDDYLQIDKDLGQSYTNVLLRVFFWDDPDNPANGVINTGSMFEAVSADGQSYTDIGIQGPGNYMIRINQDWKDTYVPRTHAWHMFEIIVTESGTYLKIDNQMVMDGPCDDKSCSSINGNLSPLKNTRQKNVRSVDFISSWGKYGRAYYDNFIAVKMNSTDALTGNINITRDFYNLYRATDFSGLYASLGIASTGSDSNDARSLFATALSFYMYGKKSGDQAAINRGIQLYRDGLNNTKWSSLNGIFKGLTLGNFAEDTYAMKSSLSEIEYNQARQIIYDNAQSFISSMPTSGYQCDTQAETNALNAFFLAEATNYFPDIPNRDSLEAKAKCFAYHSITGPNDSSYCGLTTQTIFPDWRMQNHNIDHPIYAIAVIHLLGLGALSYEKTGKSIPWEFEHNVANLYNNFILPRMDPVSFYPQNNSQVDWKGAHQSFYWALAMDFAKKSGANVNFTLDDMMSRRNIFYYNIPAIYLFSGPSSISDYMSGMASASLPRCVPRYNLSTAAPGYDWFQNSMHSGEFAASYIFSKELGCKNYCSFGLRQCNGNSYQTCIYNKSGCTEWNAAIACSANQTCTNGQCVTNTKPGDANNDGKVDVLDFNILITNFGNTSCSNPADFDKNCKVNIFDYNILLLNFGK